MSIRINDANYDDEIKNSSVPVILEFYSDSCIPCKAISPILGDIEDDYEGKIKVAKVNVNADGEFAQRFDVKASPTIVYIANGEEFDRTVGIVSKEDILERFGY